MTVTTTENVGLEPADRPSKVRKAGIVISGLVTAFLAFDAVGKLAAVPQVKEGTQAPVRR